MPFSQAVKAGGEPANIEVVLSYALIPEPEAELKAKYLATLANDQERATAKKVIRRIHSASSADLPGQVTLRCQCWL